MMKDLGETLQRLGGPLAFRPVPGGAVPADLEAFRLQIHEPAAIGGVVERLSGMFATERIAAEGPARPGGAETTIGKERVHGADIFDRAAVGVVEHRESELLSFGPGDGRAHSRKCPSDLIGLMTAAQPACSPSSNRRRQQEQTNQVGHEPGEYQKYTGHDK